jgi:methylenetetrahydrofolate dehydrogenase (NADP+)/methenyltetrahydrofolate cyclohydrolase
MQALLSAPITEKIHYELQQKAAQLIKAGIEPHVAVILVGADPASVSFVSIKQEQAKRDGIILSLYHLEEDATVPEIRQALEFLATDDEVQGIVLQLPLPEGITEAQVDELIQCIPPAKDVDVLRADTGAATDMRSPMVEAVTGLLVQYQLSVAGQKVVIVGKGRLVGQPLEAYFRSVGVDVQLVDEHTEDILKITSQADILITGTGEPDLITYQWVKEGATVINCSGDVHVDSVEQVAGALSPAKGGIGPLTVAYLLQNVLKAADHAY